MKRVVLFLLLCLSLTATIYAQGDDPEPLDVTSTFDYFEISYPEGWTITLPESNDGYNTYTLGSDPDFTLDPEDPTATHIETDQIMFTISISPMRTDRKDVFEGRTLDYYLGFVNGLQIASSEDPQYWLESVVVSDRMIAGFPGRSVLLESNFNTVEEIVYFDQSYIIFVSVWTAPGERNNPTIDAILDSIKLVNVGQKIGRLKQTFEGDLSGISLSEGMPVAIASEVEAEEITRDGITSNIWYEVEQICGTQSGLVWSGAIEIIGEATAFTTYTDYCIEYVHDPELPQEIIDEAKIGFERAYLYTRDFNVEPRVPLTIEVSLRDDIPPYCGYTENMTITMYVDDELCPLDSVAETAAHEYFHIVQFALIGELNQNTVYVKGSEIYRSQGPDWLVQGMAFYLMIRVFETDQPGSEENLNTLSEMEAFNTVHGEIGYYTASYAVSLLVDGNDHLLFDYYRSLGQQQLRGEDWKTHFEDTFGISVEDFYAQFE